MAHEDEDMMDLEDEPFPEDKTFKCVAVGDAGVGKTCLLVTYTRNEFPTEYVPTVFDTYETLITYKGDKLMFQLWDTAGTEVYDQIRPLSYTDSDCFLVVYSVDDKESLENVRSRWVTEISAGDDTIPFVLVGNKVDLRTEANADMCCSKKDGKAMAASVGAVDVFEVSAKAETGLQELFSQCVSIGAEHMLKRRAAAVEEGNGAVIAESATCCLVL